MTRIRMEDDEYFPEDMDDGMVWCDRCQGAGIVSRDWGTFGGPDERDCPVCYGEGQITKEHAEKRGATHEEMREILAKALKESEPPA